MIYVYILLALLFYLFLSHIISYKIIKEAILRSRKWDLNICCGKTDGGGVNADIYKHRDLSSFVLVENIYDLPFKDNQFDSVLCSHTIEHVKDPQKFYNELRRVGKEVVLVIPPLYDISAVLNLIEHKWIFLSFKKKHKALPKYIRLPFARYFQEKLGQRNHA